MIWHAIPTNTVDAPFSSITGSTTTGSTTPVPWFRWIELFCMLRHKSILKHGFKGFPCCLLMMLCLSLKKHFRFQTWCSRCSCLFQNPTCRYFICTYICIYKKMILTCTYLQNKYWKSKCTIYNCTYLCINYL